MSIIHCIPNRERQHIIQNPYVVRYSFHRTHARFKPSKLPPIAPRFAPPLALELLCLLSCSVPIVNLQSLLQPPPLPLRYPITTLDAGLPITFSGFSSNKHDTEGDDNNTHRNLKFVIIYPIAYRRTVRSTTRRHHEVYHWRESLLLPKGFSLLPGGPSRIYCFSVNGCCYCFEKRYGHHARKGCEIPTVGGATPPCCYARSVDQPWRCRDRHFSSSNCNFAGALRRAACTSFHGFFVTIFPARREG